MFNSFPRLSPETKRIVLDVTKGQRVLLLRLRVLELLSSYSRLTVRMLFYRLVSLYDYPNERNFYKRLQYSLKRLRKALPELGAKFVDLTRQLSTPMMPRPRIELWMEKSSLEYYLRGTADNYHVPTLSERGFGSITMFMKAVERARRRGVERILLVSDHDPSGLSIAEVTGREMPIQVDRIALTMDQIRRYKLPSIRVKRSDSRAKKYMKRFGDSAWEVEAIPPMALLRIVRDELRKNVSPALLEEIHLQEKAAKITKGLEREIIHRLRSQAAKMIGEGLTKETVLRRLRRRLAGTVKTKGWR
jgi:hypothetical protein